MASSLASNSLMYGSTSEFHCYCYIIKVNLGTIIKFKQIITLNFIYLFLR